MDKKVSEVVGIIGNESFKLWQSKGFRTLVNFEKLDQTEQDRIFNELEVTVLGLIFLYSQEVLSTKIRDNVVGEFLRVLSELGVEKKFIEIWRQLIALRFKEYKEDYKTALVTSKSWEEFKDDERMHVAWARVETLTIDGLRHIRRGRVEERDLLWKHLRKWLIYIDSMLINVLDIKDLKVTLDKN